MTGSLVKCYRNQSDDLGKTDPRLPRLLDATIWVGRFAQVSSWVELVAIWVKQLTFNFVG